MPYSLHRWCSFLLPPFQKQEWPGLMNRDRWFAALGSFLFFLCSLGEAHFSYLAPSGVRNSRCSLECFPALESKFQQRHPSWAAMDCPPIHFNPFYAVSNWPYKSYRMSYRVLLLLPSALSLACVHFLTVDMVSTLGVYDIPGVILTRWCL